MNLGVVSSASRNEPFFPLLIFLSLTERRDRIKRHALDSFDDKSWWKTWGPSWVGHLEKTTTVVDDARSPWPRKEPAHRKTGSAVKEGNRWDDKKLRRLSRGDPTKAPLPLAEKLWYDGMHFGSYDEPTVNCRGSNMIQSNWWKLSSQKRGRSTSGFS